MKSTKKALTASALCTLLCILLLVSASIAWFSASKESNINELYSGNLDVKLSYSKDMKTWTEVTETTNDIFRVTVNGEAKDMLWEPGAANVVYLKIENKGILAFGYELTLEIVDEVAGVNFDGDSFRLSDYILGGAVKGISAAYSTNDAGRAAAIKAIGTPMQLSRLCAENAKLDKGIMNSTDEHPDEVTLALVLYLPENTGDDTNYPTPDDASMRPKVPLKLKLVASQAVGETDSFGDGYDTAANPDDAPVSLLMAPADKNKIPLADMKIKSGVLEGVSDDFTGSVLSVPEGVKSISAYSFDGVAGIEKIVLPNSVTLIDDSAFQKMPDLKEVVIGRAGNTGTIQLNSSVFYLEPVLESVIINGNIKTYDSGHYMYSDSASIVFYRSPKLKHIEINGNAEFDEYNFSNISEETENGCTVVFGGDVTNTMSNALFCSTNVTEVHFGAGRVSGNMFNEFYSDSGNGPQVKKIVFDAVPATKLDDSFVYGLQGVLTTVEVADLSAWQAAGQPAALGGITVTQAP